VKWLANEAWSKDSFMKFFHTLGALSVLGLAVGCGDSHGAAKSATGGGGGSGATMNGGAGTGDTSSGGNLNPPGNPTPVAAGDPPVGGAKGDTGVWTPMLNWNKDTEPVGWEGILADPVRIGEFYAFCQLVAFGAVVTFRSSDWGATWKRVDTAQSKGSAWGNAIDPNPKRDPKTWPTLYALAGYGSQGVWKSVDGGVTWVNLFANGGTVPAAGGGTVTFPPDKNGQNTDFYQVHILPDNMPNHILVTYHYGKPGSQALGESADGGLTWSLHNVPWGDSHYVYGVDANTWLLIDGEGGGGGIRRTTTAGRVNGVISEAAWTQVDTLEHIHGAFNPWFDAKSSTLYFPGKTGVHSTSDGGVTWSPIYTMPMSTMVATDTTVFTSVLGDKHEWQAPVDNVASLAQLPSMPPTFGNSIPPYGAVSVFDGTHWVVLEVTRNQPSSDNKSLLSNGEIWRYIQP
jgi:hypothetical protein